jgi:hypothetical protein
MTAKEGAKEMTEETGEKRLSFLVVREEWSEYKLVSDGSLVRTKVAISDVIDTGRKEGKLQVRFAFKNVFFKEPSIDDKGEPSADQKTSKDDEIEEMKREKIREPISIYDVPDKFILLVKAQLTDLKKTKKFDASGNRIYNYGISVSINVVEYPK